MVSTKPRASSERIYDERTAMVKELVAKESAALDARTARLKALRLAKESAEPAPAPKAAKKKTGAAAPKPRAKLAK
jgi:hypothetical protein